MSRRKQKQMKKMKKLNLKKKKMQKFTNADWFWEEEQLIFLKETKVWSFLEDQRSTS